MYKKFELKNGLPVIIVPKKESRSVAVFLTYKVGSRHERSEKIYGISHFIEHLFFKGTKKKPSTLAISKELDSIGAEFNAYTAKDHTAYHIKANAESLEKICEILSDMMNNSLFDTKKLEQEKGVVVEEIKMYEDQPIQYAEILFEELLYKDSDLEHNIAGTRDSVRGISRKDIINYLHEFYSPKNAVLLVVGKIENKDEKILKKYFLAHGFGKKFNKKVVFNPLVIKQKGPKVLLHYKETNQVHLTMGFPACSYSDDRLYALYLLATVLGGSMSSRLFIDVREKNGLCYYIRSQVDVYENTGDLMIRAGLDIDKLEKAISLIVKNLRGIKEKGITEVELQKAKQFLRGRLILQLEDLNDLADFYGREFILTNRLMTPEQKIEKIMAVTRKEVNRVAKEIINKEKLNLVMISPHKTEPDFIKKIINL